jgi:glycosyltransferase involved in cell wall biosynthesis
MKKKLEKLLLTRLYPWADEIIAISQDLATDFCQYTGISGNRVRVIYSSIITPELEARRAAPLDHPWFQPGQPPVILAVGRLTYQKNFELLLHAFGQVRENRAARLLILGEGDERPALESLAIKLGIQADVSMPGLVENPYTYMRRAAVLALSSRYEGLPTVLVEALACGCPVVSTNCTSGPAEILAGGSYGHLVPVGDHQQLGKAIELSLAGDVRTPPASWLRQFELETVADQYLQMMRLDDERKRQQYHPEAGKT